MSQQDTAFYQKNNQGLSVIQEPLVMGILNVTPNSFFDGGKFNTEKAWITHTEKMIAEGADIIDIGVHSTKPNSETIPEAEELKQSLSVIKSIKKNFPKIIISVDTFRAKIAEVLVNEGASIINDISGGTMDEKMFATVAKLQVPYVLMHIKGTPKNMQQNPQYKNVTVEVFNYFEEKINDLKKLNFDKIIIDPGFGFGKNVEHNFQLLKELEQFKSLGLPILAGLSRKSMINTVLNTNSANALNGTTVLNTIALQKGANILRVHDVKEAKEIIKLLSVLK